MCIIDSHSGTDTRRRIWVGRDDDDTASVQLMDANGKKRMILEVKPDGSPRISFLDANGKVTNTIPASGSKREQLKQTHRLY